MSSHSLESQILFAISQGVTVGFSSVPDSPGDVFIRISEPMKPSNRVTTLVRFHVKSINKRFGDAVEEALIRHARMVEANRVRLQSQPEIDQK